MRGWVLGLFLGLSLLAGCAVSPFGPSPKQQLANLTVHVPPLQHSIKLVDGRYNAGGVQAQLLQVAGGELGGDRGRDAVGVLEVVVPGKGLHYLLLASVGQGERRLASSIYLGSRLKLDRLVVEDRVAQLRLKRMQQGDLTCCPSLTAAERYRWQGNKLQEIAPALVATRWEVVELWGRPLQVAPDTRPHLTLATDNSGQLFGGCNELTVGYQVKGPALRIDGVSGGTQYCNNTPEEDVVGALIQIDRYALQGSTLELYSGNEVLAKLRAAPGGSDDQ